MALTTHSIKETTKIDTIDDNVESYITPKETITKAKSLVMEN